MKQATDRHISGYCNTTKLICNDFGMLNILLHKSK